MAIIIRQAPPTKVNHRKSVFNDAVRKLAPMIAEVRSKGACSVVDIMNALNERAVVAPSGGPFTFGATHRILKRLEGLHLGDGPRLLSKAISARPYVQRRRRRPPGKSDWLEGIAREHPELLEGLSEPVSTQEP